MAYGRLQSEPTMCKFAYKLDLPCRRFQPTYRAYNRGRAYWNHGDCNSSDTTLEAWEDHRMPMPHHLHFFNTAYTNGTVTAMRWDVYAFFPPYVTYSSLQNGGNGFSRTIRRAAYASLLCRIFLEVEPAISCTPEHTSQRRVSHFLFSSRLHILSGALLFRLDCRL